MLTQNEYASQNAFLMNNPNIKNSDLLDLHNLTVKEAVGALKQIMFEKKQRIYICHLNKMFANI
jgi:hypothetical protein